MLDACLGAGSNGRPRLPALRLANLSLEAEEAQRVAVLHSGHYLPESGQGAPEPVAAAALPWMSAADLVKQPLLSAHRKMAAPCQVAGADWS